MESQRFSVPIKQRLLHLIGEVARSTAENSGWLFSNIKTELESFSEFIKSSPFGFNEVQTTKIVLKLHQIILELSPEFQFGPLTNYYEAHALYHLTASCEAAKGTATTEYLMYIILTEEEPGLADGEVWLNKDMVWLAVTARGAYNLYMNAVAGSLLKHTSIPILPYSEELVASAYRLLQDSKENYVSEELYEDYREIFVWGTTEEIEINLADLTRDLLFSVLRNDKDSLAYIEKLLVCLLGHNSSFARDLAVAHLNVFYDDTDWQLLEPFVPKITTCGKELVIAEILEEVPDNILLELHAPGFHVDSKNYLISYHKPRVQKTKKGGILKANLGKFPRCGFYDWRISYINAGAICPVMVQSDGRPKPLQGRFIVHPKDTKDLQIHEIFVDFQGAEFSNSTGQIIKRGSFSEVKNSLRERYDSGINCLYLMGALERDIYNQECSPLSITCRSTASTLLGGVNDLQALIQEAETIGMKLVVDCVARVSSKNYHRRYKDEFLLTRNNEGLPVLFYGTDGRAVKFEDSVLLNYRKAHVWNLLVDDVLRFYKQFKVHGIHIDNAQSWPQILELDHQEMYRTDPDGEPHYSSQEIFEGKIVNRNEHFAYWASPMKERYPNPLFIKLCKELWRHIPDFYIIADVWHGSGLEGRDSCVIRSGGIPRLYDLPIKLSAIFGKKLHKNGMTEPMERQDVSIMKEWVEQKRPVGSMVIQSSTGHSLPYPALLYGRGAWAAVDVLMFMEYIPMSFIGEQAGHAYRSRIPCLYDFKQPPKSSIPSTLSGANMVDLESEAVNLVPLINSTTSLTTIPNISELMRKEEKFFREIGPEYGFDLKKIRHHYQHRRLLRKERKVLRYGELVPLVMRHDHGWHKHVLAFARCLPEEIVVITINLNENPVQGYLDLGRLASKLIDTKVLIYTMTDWFNSDEDAVYFREEILKDKIPMELLPFHSSIKGLYASDMPTEKALSESLKRLSAQVAENRPTDGNYLIQRLSKLVDKEVENHKEILNVFGLIYKYAISEYNIDPLRLMENMKVLDDNKRGSLLGICDYVLSLEKPDKPPPIMFAETLVLANRIGPIVFTCPELGRFSTAGGLGVMVDELSQGLVSLGQEIWVISPYYERNKHGQSGYLANDPANINWIFNVDAQVGHEKYTLGVHRGYENGIHLLFLHCPFLLPHVYADGRGHYIIKQLVAWGKGVLETLCALSVIPSLLITNDWFTALVPAYAKIGAFGNTFDGTKFVHIVHNLDPSYEGRLYPSPSENGYCNIHGLPKHLFVDPYWKGEIFNPSRCALMMSDQWATVSPSYRNELLRESSLKELLKSKPQPFAFPNGIPMQKRLEKIKDLGTHLDAKKVLQQKYFQFQGLDNSCALMSFVGRIVSQKGVSLILDAAERLIPSSNFKIQILIGGPANYNDPYSASCAHRMKNLRNRYPHNFYADPDNFFYDGPLVNLGSDFGLMPSQFEPGGIVQHEFFLAGTPVVAFKTGGLSDTVHEYTEQAGGGFLFQSYNMEDFIWAINRGLHVYFHGTYDNLRKKAFESTIDGAVVSRAWLKEFYRLQNKMFYEYDARKNTLEELRKLKWVSKDFDDSLPQNNASAPSIPRTPSTLLLEKMEEMPATDNKRHSFFMYTNPNYRPKSVQLTGSFDRWQIRHPMVFDHIKNFWHVTLMLEKGVYFYKFVIDGSIWVISEDHPTQKDSGGNLNNKMEVL